MANEGGLLSVTELNLIKMNKEQQFKRLAMNIVNQLFDLADLPVEKRQSINDEADAFVLRVLQQLPSKTLLPLTQEQLNELKTIAEGYTYMTALDETTIGVGGIIEIIKKAESYKR